MSFVQTSRERKRRAEGRRTGSRLPLDRRQPSLVPRRKEIEPKLQVLLSSYLRLTFVFLAWPTFQLPTHRVVRGFPQIQPRRDLDSRGGEEDRVQDRPENHDFSLPLVLRPSGLSSCCRRPSSSLIRVLIRSLAFSFAFFDHQLDRG